MIFLHRFALLYCVNTLWQIPLLYLAASLSDRLLRRSSAVLRHRLWTAAFVLCFTLPLVSSTGYPRAYLEHAMLQSRGVSRSASLAIVARADRRHEFSDAAYSVLRGGTAAQILLVLWGACMLYRTVRIAWGHRRIAQLITKGYKLERTGFLRGLSPPLLIPTRGNALEVLISEEVGMPATARILRPLVLLPKVLADTALMCDLDAVLAHEHAHIVRRDYMWNLILEILAIPLAYNPVMRRLLGRIAETREFICDRMAAESMGNAARYAQSLVRISEMLLKPIPSTNPALGLFDGQVLENRVMSLLHPSHSNRNRNAIMVLLSVSIFAPCCVAAVGLPYQPAALVASDLQPYSGTWHWMFKGKPFVTMHLVTEQDHFTGYMTNGFFSYDGDGNMTDAGSHTGRSAVVRTFFAGSTLHIVVQNDQDKSLTEWTMKVTGPKSAEFATADPKAPKNFKPWTAERSAD